jgi:hypothetical protein
MKVRGDYVCPRCGAYDSTRCDFDVSAYDSQIVPSQVIEAHESGCRVEFYTRLLEKGRADAD